MRMRVLKKRLVILSIAVVTSLLALYFANLKAGLPQLTFRKLYQIEKSRDDKKVLRDEGVHHDKWIVLTSISPPTDDVKFLANIPGWKLLVVGDTKSPKNWRHPNSIFLDVSKQLRLGLRLPEHLPYQSYSRKNVGYLYALAHGATVIYETDDDNRPFFNLSSFDLQPTTSGLMYSGSSSTFNPYRHFGQPTLWPRGFPLGRVGADHKDEYRLSNSWPTPVIQQGVVNGDPDMDAIFRLTRKKTNEPLHVNFDSAAPPVILPPGVLSPFNTQNTLFHKEAFWALLIPTTTNFRICDIWRGYWSQRLLWEINGHVGFYPPNAYQNRSAHDYMDDMQDEDPMYYDTERLVSFLTQWICPGHFTFFQCVNKLSLDMSVENFWKEGDVLVTKYWLEDLIRIGYTEPKRVRLNMTWIKSRKTSDSMQSINDGSDIRKKKQWWLGKGTRVQLVAADQTPPEITPSVQSENTDRNVQQMAAAAKLCPMVANFTVPTHKATQNYFEDTLLVIIFNWPHYHATRVLEAIYRPLFPNMLYCGQSLTKFVEATSSFAPRGLSFVEVPGIENGYFGQLCLVKAMQVNYNVTGYLVTGDDVLVNVWNFIGFNKSKIWMIEWRGIFPLNEKGVWWWWNGNMGKPAYMASLESIKFLAKIETFHKRRHSGFSHSDQIKGVEKITELVSQNNNKLSLINDQGDKEFGLNQTMRVLDELHNKPSMFLTNLESNVNEIGKTVRGMSDIYYIPSRLRNDVIFYFTLLTSHKLFLELAVPILIYGIENKEKFEPFRGKYLWHSDRLHVWRFFDPQNHLIHPVKYSNATNIKLLCQKYIPLLLEKSLSK